MIARFGRRALAGPESGGVRWEQQARRRVAREWEATSRSGGIAKPEGRRTGQARAMQVDLSEAAT